MAFLLLLLIIIHWGVGCKVQFADGSADRRDDAKDFPYERYFIVFYGKSIFPGRLFYLSIQLSTRECLNTLTLYFHHIEYFSMIFSKRRRGASAGGCWRVEAQECGHQKVGKIAAILRERHKDGRTGAV